MLKKEVVYKLVTKIDYLSLELFWVQYYPESRKLLWKLLFPSFILRSQSCEPDKKKYLENTDEWPNSQPLNTYSNFI
jgi:hypothetical protein